MISTIASHNQLHMYGYTDIVNLLGNAPDTALHLWCGALRYKSPEIWITLKEILLLDFVKSTG